MAEDTDASKQNQQGLRNAPAPRFGLDVAIDRVRPIYRQVKRNPTTRILASTFMGYKGLSGASGLMLGTLSQYGLIEESGKGSLRVTELAEGILHPVSDEERLSLLEKAAVKPKAFAAILERIGGTWDLPQQNTLNVILIRELRYSESVAKEILDSLLATRDLLEEIRVVLSVEQLADQQSDSKKAATLNRASRLI